MLAPEKRITQRAPQSYVQCSRRKLRCSKLIPCTNCVERGMKDRCHREAVILTRQNSRSGNISRPRSQRRSLHRDNVEATVPRAGEHEIPLISDAHERSSSSSPGLRSAHEELGAPMESDRSLRSLRPRLSPMPIPEYDIASSIAASMSKRAPCNTQDDTADFSTRPDEGDLAIEAAMSLECLAWGSYREQEPTGLSPAVLAVIDQLQSLVGKQEAQEIILFYQSYVAWMHNVLYMPLFTRHCDVYLSRRLQPDVAGLTSYSAVLCVSSSPACNDAD
jgi:hypothetical protein